MKACELRAAFSALDETDIPIEEFQACLNEVDASNNGIVNINEFIAGMKKFTEDCVASLHCF